MLHREDPRSPPTYQHHTYVKFIAKLVTLTASSDYTNTSCKHSVWCMPKLKRFWNANVVVLDFPASTTPPALNELRCLSVQRSTIDEMRLPDLFARPSRYTSEWTERQKTDVAACLRRKESAQQLASTLTAAT